MPDKIKINEESGIVEIISFGAVSKRDIESSIAKTNQINEEIGINKVLVDTTEQDSMPNTFDIFSLFSQFPRDLRVALLANQDQPTSQEILFSETVAVNRGLTVRVFKSREEALSWLNP